MRTLTILSLLQALFLFSFAQERNGKIDGVVKDGDGKVLDAVTVSILKQKDSSLVKIALTDKSGVFTFDHIAARRKTADKGMVVDGRWISGGSVAEERLSDKPPIGGLRTRNDESGPR